MTPDAEEIRVQTKVIVVGVDGSREGWAALEWALEEAERTGRRLRIVHVWDWMDEVVGPGRGAGSGKALLRQALATVGSRVQAEARLVEGEVVAALADASRDAAMLVVGVNHQGLVRRLLQSSVAADTLRAARCPVVVVPAPPGAPAPRPEGGPSGEEPPSA